MLEDEGSAERFPYDVVEKISSECIGYDVLKNTTKCFIFIFLAVFTLISIIAVWPDSGKDHNSGFTSAELELEEKTEKKFNNR